MKVLYVFVGGFLGTLLRYTFNLMIQPIGWFPLNTFLINIIGCFFLAFFLTFFQYKLRPELILLIGTGFTGAFTTFSTFSLEVVKLVTATHFLIGFLYFFLSIGLGIVFSMLGYMLAEKMSNQKGGEFS